MQMLSGRGPGGLNAQSRRIAILAILLFGLSGLISGFAVGAFIHPKAAPTTGTTGPGGATSPASQTTKSSTKSTSSENVKVGWPILGSGDYTYRETADGTTAYSLSALIVKEGTHTPIQATDVTCKLWLTNDGHINDLLSANGYAIPRDSAHLSQPFADEVPNSLTFAAPSKQTQNCAAGIKTKWTYTLSSTVQPGQYFLVVLADWKGQHYNWSWVDITIKQAGS
jgi:hypothetical protein